MSLTTDLYAVIGNPVAHSKSPDIHAAFARQTGQSLAYERVQVALDGFEAGVRAFAARPGARGCNITVPFKFDAMRMAAGASARARLAGAANVLRFDAGGSWFADNTDGAGLVGDIERNAGFPIAGRRVLLVGAGGGAAGALGPLIAARPARIVVANRTADKAVALVERHAAWARENGVDVAAVALADAGGDRGGDAGRRHDLVVNASASSLQGLTSPVPASVLAPGALAVDLMYGPAAEPFVAWARAAGATARDGLGMLVEQAAEAFFVWRGVRPDTAPVLAALGGGSAAAAGPAPA